METSLLPSESYCLLEVLLMPAILASFFAYNPQKTIGIVSISGLYAWFAYLFVNRRLSTTLSQSPAFYSTLISSATNCGSLSDIILTGNPCSFHTLFLNNLANPFADISSVVATKCVILEQHIV